MARRETITWTAPDLQSEVGEYLENPHTKTFLKSKGLEFKDEKEVLSFLKTGKLIPVTKEELTSRFDNISTDSDFEKELKDRVYQRSYKSMEKELAEKGSITLPAPIILKIGDVYYGFSGNRRMNLAFRHDIPLKVWLVGQKKSMKLSFGIRLFVDDLRDPKEYGLDDAVWVKSYGEAVDRLKTGNVSWISFDHDLGEGKSGYDVAKYIEESVHEGNMPCPEWQIHSANPTGRKNIERAMKSAERFKMKTASKSEEEVERFLKAFLPDTPFKGLVKAVGGYVRDQYLSLLKNDPSIEAKDLDLVVNMKDGSEKLTKYIYEKIKDTAERPPVSEPRQLGKDYPIWQLAFKNDLKYKGETYKTEGAVIEFADTMKEYYPDPTSRQRKTEPASLEEDIQRRDFSVNMLLKDMTTGEVEDLTGISKEDIEKGVLRGHPKISMDKIFNADPLRMLRLIRFQAKYGWDIPMSVLRAVKRNAERITIVSSERILGELTKIMKLGKLKQAIKLMSATGLLKHILPEIEALKGVQQRPDYHNEGDVYRHTLMVLQNAPAGVENQIAALLHDVGKPATTALIDGKIKSKGHEDVGADMAEAIMKRLKFDNDAIGRVKKMVKNHMRAHSLGRNSGPKALRKFVRDVGEDMVEAILALARADELGKIPPTDEIPDLKKRIEEAGKIEIKKETDTVLNGREIMELLGIPSGTEVGRAKKFLTELSDDYAEKGRTLAKEDARRALLEDFRASALERSELLRKPKKASLADTVRKIFSV